MSLTVYGYITLENDDETEIERLHDQLTAHAGAQGWMLAEVIVDRNTPPAGSSALGSRCSWTPCCVPKVAAS